MKNGKQKAEFIKKIINSLNTKDLTIEQMYIKVKPLLIEKVLIDGKIKKQPFEVSIFSFRNIIKKLIDKKEIYFYRSKNHKSNCFQSIYFINSIIKSI